MYFLLVLALVAVIVSVYSRTADIGRRVKGLEGELRRLRRELDTLQAPGAETGREPHAHAAPAAPEEVPSVAADVVPRAEIPVPPPIVAPAPAKPVAAKTAAPPDREALPVAEFDRPEAAGPVKAPPPPPLEPLGAKLVAALKKLGPDDPDMGWEMALGTYWLPRVGIAALSIAVVFLLTLAAQRFGPPVRVGIGYAVCATLLALGWRLEARYRLYARVLYAGGIATSYFVTFALYFVPFARLFDTPAIPLALLAIVVAGWALVAQRRQSRIVAFLAALLGHLTIAAGTYALDEPARFAVAGIVLLSAGSAFFLLRNGWYYVAAVGLAGSYVNQFYLFVKSEPSDEVIDFVVGMAVLVLYLVIYALTELAAKEDTRRRAVPLWFRSGFVGFNSAAFLLMGTILVSGFDFAEPYHHVFRYALAAFLFGMALLYLRVRTKDPLHNVYAVKASGVLALGLAAQFNAQALTTSLAVEMVVLLFAARRSTYPVYRLTAFGAALLAFGHGLYTVEEGAFRAYAAPGYTVLAVQSAFAVLAFFVASLLYERTNWAARTPRLTFASRDWQSLLWQFDLVAELPEGLKRSKPASGLLFPYAYLAAGAVLYCGYGVRLIALEDRPLAFVLVAGALALAAVALRGRAYGRAVAPLAGIGVLWSVLAQLDRGVLAYASPDYASACCKTACALAVTLAIAEYCRRSLSQGRGEGLPYFPALGFLAMRQPIGRSYFAREAESAEDEALLPFVLALMSALIFLPGVYSLIAEGHRILALAAGVTAYLGLAYALNSLAFGLHSLVVLVAALIAGSFEMAEGVSLTIGISSLLILGGSALFYEPFLPERRAVALHRAPYTPYFLYAAPAWLLGLFLMERYDRIGASFALALAATAAGGLGNVLHRRALPVCATALLVWAGLVWGLADAQSALRDWRLLTLFVVALALIGERYFTWRGVGVLSPVLMVLAWLVLMRYAVLEAPRAWAPFSWAVIAAAFLAYAWLIRTKTSVALSLLATFIASLDQTVYAYDKAMPVAAVIAGFGGVILMWIVWERAGSLVLARGDAYWGEALAAIFVAAASTLSVTMLERIPFLAEFLLTASWSLLGVLLFVLALAFGQRYYRYAGLAVLLLAMLRVVAIDTRALDPLPRVAAWAVLGVVMLALGFGYVKAFGGRPKARGGEAQDG